MKPSLWTVEFGSNVGMIGAGVVTLTPDRISGGDAKYYYIGSFKIENGQVSASIYVNHYHGEPLSVFGTMKNFNVVASGKYQEPKMVLSGHLENNPKMIITLNCTKIADL